MIEGLPPLPGLHEALAYIAKGNPPAPVVKLDPGLEGDDDDDLELGALDEADDPVSEFRPDPSEMLMALMILRIYGAAASCDQPLRPEPGLLSTVIISGPEDRRRFAQILPDLPIVRPKGAQAPVVAIEDGSTVDRSIKELTHRVEGLVERGKPVIVGTSRPERLPAELLALESVRVILPPVDRRMLGALLEVLHPTQQILIPMDDADLALVPAIHLAPVFAAETADQAADRLRRIAVKRPAVSAGPTLDDVHGQPEAVAALRQVVRDLQEWRAGRLEWSEVTKSFLLVGPPGTGKTMLAQALAGSSGITFVKTSYSDCQKMGHQGDFLRELNASADRAQAGAPAEWFVDEIDSFHHRGQSTTGYMVGVVNGFLTTLDRLSATEGVILVAATNDVARIDPAVIRAGRFDKHIRVNPPDRGGVRTFLSSALVGMMTEDHLDRLADQMMGRTGAELTALVRDARTRARAEGKPFSADHVQAAADAVQPPLDPDLMWRVCLHEAGHLVAGAVFGLPAATSARVTPTGGEVLRPGKPSHTRESIRAYQCAVLAGRAAEEVLLGDISSGGGTGATSDLAQATRLAMEAEFVLGFGPTLTWVPLETPYFLLPEALRQRIEASLQVAQTEARAAMDRHRTAVERVAGALSERRELDAGLIADLLSDIVQEPVRAEGLTSAGVE
ncbi:AAA family ATPase [Tabrizicola soli]|uniref:AAA family ATPase n=1 Tax=Tabrizicola soli TaxID=2185115 RepID=A0ABV7DNK7_9RHOB